MNQYQDPKKASDPKNPQDKSKQTNNGWPFPDFNFNPFMNTNQNQDPKQDPKKASDPKNPSMETNNNGWPFPDFNNFNPFMNPSNQNKDSQNNNKTPLSDTTQKSYNDWQNSNPKNPLLDPIYKNID